MPRQFYFKIFTFLFCQTIEIQPPCEGHLEVSSVLKSYKTCRILSIIVSIPKFSNAVSEVENTVQRSKQANELFSENGLQKQTTCR